MRNLRVNRGLAALAGTVFLALACGAFMAPAVNGASGDASAPGSGPENLPVLQVSEVLHDFGELPEGESVSHDFIVKNTGGGELVIQKVRPD